MVTVPTKRKETSSNPTRLWHMRLGHINLNRINRLVQLMKIYEWCLEGKITKRPFPVKGNRTNALLELVHTNVCGPIHIRARGGYEYFISFIDDHSRYGYVYLMQHKFEASEKFKEFRAEVEKQLDTHIKAIRSDRGCEYLSNEFIDHLVQNGILS